MRMVFRRWVRKAIRHQGLMIGLILTSLVISLGIISLVVTPHDSYQMDFSQRLVGPNPQHWFGTDDFGRDLFSRCMIGARVALLVGVISTGIALVAGLLLGFVAGLGSRWVDEIIMRMMDGLYAFPALLFAIGILAVWGPNIYHAMIGIGIVRIPIFARQIRSSTRSVKEREFVKAAYALGIHPLKISVVHILPNILSSILVLVSSNFAFAILSEAGLSYIGLGTQPPMPSWGRMLLESQRFIERAPWLSFFPGMMIAITVLGFTLLGDGLRDLLDPNV